MYISNMGSEKLTICHVQLYVHAHDLYIGQLRVRMDDLVEQGGPTNIKNC